MHKAFQATSTTRSVGQMAVGEARFEIYNFKELILLRVFVVFTL